MHEIKCCSFEGRKSVQDSYLYADYDGLCARRGSAKICDDIDTAQVDASEWGRQTFPRMSLQLSCLGLPFYVVLTPSLLNIPSVK